MIAGCVLVVEDDRDIRESLGELLVDAGFEPALAENGQVALDRLARDPLPDLIVLDLAMPVMDGLELRRHQVRDPRTAGIPVVLFSADGDLPAKAAALGIAHAIRKPLDVDAFLDLVCALVAARRG